MFRCFALGLAALLVLTLPRHAVAGTVTGRTFLDFNSNGSLDVAVASNTAIDVGVAGVTIRAHGSTGVGPDGVAGTADDLLGACGSTLSAADGAYTLAHTCIGPSVRVSFDLPAGQGYSFGPMGPSSSGQTVVTSADAMDINLALVKASSYCENNPLLAVNCYAGLGLNDPVIYDFRYVSGAAGLNPPFGDQYAVTTAAKAPLAHQLQIGNNVVGATWGLAWNRKYKKLFAGAFSKSHTGYGGNSAANPAGVNSPGAIYVMDRGNLTGPAVSTASILVSLPAGPNRHALASETCDANAGSGVFCDGAWLDSNVRQPQAADVGKNGLGGMVMSSADDALFAVNLFDSKIYRVALSGSSAPVAGAVSSFDASAINALTSDCAADATTPVGSLNKNLRLGALSKRSGKLYFGATCTAQSSGNAAGLRAYVFSIPESLSGAPVLVLSAPLNYARGAAFSVNGATLNCVSPSLGGANATSCTKGEWNTWVDTLPSVNPARSPRNALRGFVIYPQPWLLGLDFTHDGRIILGLTDRLGHQTGSNAPTVNPTSGSSGVAVGDTLCASPNATQTAWTIESNGTCGTVGSGVGNAQGPGGGEFFGQDFYAAGVTTFSGVYATDFAGLTAGAHTENSIGGVAVLPGFSNVMASAFDPVNNGEFTTGGVAYYDHLSGNKTRAYTLYGEGQRNSFGKAAGLGDIEPMCSIAPIEIGNRVWLDANRDGLQDANEIGIAGVRVELRTAVGALLATTLTDADGYYAFSNDPRGYDAATGNTAPNDVLGATGGYTIANDGNINQGGRASTASRKYGILGLLATTGYQVVIPNISGASKQAALGAFTLTTANVGGDTSNDPTTDTLDSDATTVGADAVVPITTGLAGDNNHSLDVGFVAPSVIDLTITKTLSAASVGPYTPGSTVSFVLTASNLGPSTARPAIVVVDRLPSQMSFVSASGLNWSCSAIAQEITCTRLATASPLVANATADPVTITVTLGAGNGGTVLINYAKVLPAANEPLTESIPVGTANTGYETGNPTIGSNNDASASVMLNAPQQIDLTIAKSISTATPGPYAVGSSIIFNLVATNLGPGTAQPAIVVKDRLPAGLSFSSASGVGWSCSFPFQELICTRSAAAAALPAGTSAAVINVNVTVAAGAAGSLINLAQVNPASGEPLIETIPLGTTNGGYETGNPLVDSNNDASATVNVTAPLLIDLTLAKSVSTTTPGPYAVGSAVSFLLTPTNLGPGTAQAAIIVKDRLPASLTYVSAAGVNWTCAFLAPEITCTRAASAGALVAGTSATTITVNVTIAAGAAGSLINLAHVRPSLSETLIESNPLGLTNGGYETGDTASGSNNDTSAAINVSAITASIDLAIAKTIAAPPVGGFVIGSTVSYTIAARNNGPATAQSAIIVTDRFPASLNFVSATGTNWVCVYAAPDVTCTRSSGAFALLASTQAETIQVVGTIRSGTSPAAPIVNYARVEPAATETRPETIPLGTTNSGFETGDPTVGSNNDASATLSLAAPLNIDLSITKQLAAATPGPFVAGATVSFNLLATNRGPGTAQPAIVIKDRLPAGLNYGSAIGTNWSCAFVSPEITCSRAASASPLAASAVADLITVNTTVAPGTLGSLTNFAQVNPAAGEPLVESIPLGTANGGYETGDPATGSNNDASAVITVGVPPLIDLSISKSIAVATPGPYTIGSPVSYTLVARNLGPATARPAIVIKDRLPAALNFVSASGTNWMCAYASLEITCTRSASAEAIVAGATAEAVTVNVVVSAGATGSLVNLAQVNPAANETLIEAIPLGAANGGYETGDPAVGSNNDASAPLVIAPPRIDLLIAKLLSPTTPGPFATNDTIAYQLVAQNRGPDTAQAGIFIKDRLPVGLSFVSAVGLNWTCAASGQDITCARSAGAMPLISGLAAEMVLLTARITAASGTLVNFAQVLPATNETIIETIPLGSTNAGYETGDPNVDSNNDASLTILVSAPVLVAYSIGNRVWIDANNNGAHDANELGVDGVQVTLKTTTGAVIQTVATNGGGYYRFDNLSAGAYIVAVDATNFIGAGKLVGYQSSTGSQAGVDRRDNGGDTAPNEVRSGSITLGPGDNAPLGETDLSATGAGAADQRSNMTVDFGFTRPVVPLVEAPVPMLSTWALLLMGLFIAGLACRSSRLLSARAN
jgi:uncharacterized repeat protein (TIGR01451 family)